MTFQLSRCFDPCWPPVYPPWDGSVCVPVPVCPTRKDVCPCEPLSVPQCPLPCLVAPAIAACPCPTPCPKTEPDPGYPHCRKNTC
ncbi:small proline-rich protein 2B-like [Agrilus planipennis]|uniref:Small proline-rich protein 2B-like n=1 Tax=Agrilus planipennis TaxID=224129 RepID=A0A1W4WWU6_AGRPL|nr:small proline-rich protein 2B-like [Agrilus planipennis]